MASRSDRVRGDNLNCGQYGQYGGSMWKISLKRLKKKGETAE